ncbi:MBL fold metallo-hydrolase [Cognatishimia sp. 1_MG-2023]|uniref:MBL fold metallo-hydrolase n=1 Tax=Cognatishimia sp. 1_MG-2023 TaxID=3062642 RepID=UPI0026E210C9|nr:MBL fold metallo-hydrolase [Cognatishimia sp. 1_MG-2023]MDO6725658.1 MBL fold metallo-hydrolase [Cognatishimia sp. 1_MG-2023]
MRWIILLLFVASGASAQERRASHCIAVAENISEATYVHKAAFRDAVPEDSVRIIYIDHSAFLIQTEGGLNAVTDFTGFIGTANFLPDIVTMNHAHSSHWTPVPDPAIPHVLEGWGAFGVGIEHHLDLGEMLVRNVSTDIRSGFEVEPKGNSIFVFEVAGMCIGHLGHLHHEPDAAQYAALGRLDVVMAAVDGGRTLDLPTMMKVLRRLKASIVIPMHWFDEATLGAFLIGMSEVYDIDRGKGSDVVVSLRSLPKRPKIIVLQPKFLTDP